MSCLTLFFRKALKNETVVSLLKEIRNFIPYIIRVWSLFCPKRVYKSLHFLPILLES